MSRVLLFSGGGDYTDPWHPFAATSAIVADLLGDDGHEVEVVDRLDALAAAITGADLLVVNAGGGDEPHRLDDRLCGILDRYHGPLLALHVSATLLPTAPEWERLIGGRWVRGRSMHPPRGPLRVKVVDDREVGAGSLGAGSVPRSALVDDLGPLETVDEAYTWLRVGAEADVLLVHERDGTRHPLCWIVDDGDRRRAFDALGHDAEAYEAPLARELVRRLVRWLVEENASRLHCSGESRA